MKKLVIILLFGACLPAQASFVSDFIQEAGDNLGPQHYESAQKGYATFGSFSTRVERKTLNPISITPPELSVGCGGIDIMTGGFSYVKGEEIVEFFKSVSKNATYVAASLAVKQLCPECVDTVSEVMNYAQRLNSFQLDSCALLRSIWGGLS